MALNRFALLLLLPAIIFTGITGCSDDDDDIQAPRQEGVEGRWDVNKFKLETLDYDKEEIIHSYVYEGSGDDFIKFEDDGSYHEIIDGDEKTGSYEVISDEVLIIKRNIGNGVTDDTEYEYTVSSSQLELVSEEELDMVGIDRRIFRLSR